MTSAITEMPAGFADKALSAQSTFRSAMNAMARPGTVQHIVVPSGVPAPMMPGAAAMALTLFDQDTPVWLDAPMAATSDAAQWIRFHCSAPIVADAGVAHFAVIGDPGRLTGFNDFALGSDEYPDRSTTLIIQVESLSQGQAMELSGPGIDGTTMLRATIGIPGLLDHLDANHALFPRGIDLILVAGESIVAMPRTTRVAAKEG